jgi:hypothetical protein
MKLFGIVVTLVMSVTPVAVSAGTEAEDAAGKKAALVAAEISTIANQLSLRPGTAIDFSKVSGQYCFFLGWDKHHSHYAIDPTTAHEDTIDFVDARPLLGAGVNLGDLPAMPEELGKMTPGQWYYLDSGKLDPHHGEKWDFPMMLRASVVE